MHHSRTCVACLCGHIRPIPAPLDGRHRAACAVARCRRRTSVWILTLAHRTAGIAHQLDVLVGYPIECAIVLPAAHVEIVLVADQGLAVELGSVTACVLVSRIWGGRATRRPRQLVAASHQLLVARWRPDG